jgi:general nucleoside transport system ATP-binding protein
MSPRLRLTNITKRYPGVVAADAVSFAVMPGELVAVLGENGAGKSTLVKTIYGVVQPDAGRIEFDGVQVRSRARHRRVRSASRWCSSTSRCSTL